MSASELELLEHALEAAKEAALEAGGLIRSAFRVPMSELSLDTKSSEVDLVTATDKACEAAIRDRLAVACPSFLFLGEEEASADYSLVDIAKQRSFETYVWATDPLDGTTNFVCRFPHSCVSIGLIRNGEPVLGVVYNPFRDELFYGITGRGSFYNGRRLHVNTTDSELRHALVATNVPSNRSERATAITCDFISRLMRVPVRGIRMQGSCALDLCMIAKGDLTAYSEDCPWPWDTCAGAVILREAGGVLFGFEGGSFNVFQRGVLAANCVAVADSLRALKLPTVL